MCHNSSNWTEVLPFVLLGIRSAWKEDLQTSSAELVYGEPLRFPGQFIAPSNDHTTGDITTLVTRLRTSLANLTPKPASWHRNSPFYIPRDLKDSSHVFLRQDHVRRPLEPPYSGPHKVVERNPKVYKIIVSGKTVTVSIDRLKPAYLMREADVLPDESAQPAPEVKRTRSGRKVTFPDYYRSQ
ncbi:uncharacterized protein [Epargyreus clarus]|uniref:uncharacterized protein n=1 Tax=Epargyreus clarus TaxID=520877 RepID=UPI003C2FCED8